MVKAEQLCIAACKYLGQLYSVMDCQGFVERALSDCGNKTNLAGSNAWYRRMTWVGSPEECKAKFGKIPLGAFLFILSDNGKEPDHYKSDGIGNASHIGIYTNMSGAEMVKVSIDKFKNSAASGYNFGNGAIHSSSSRAHVCTSTFAGKAIRGGWNKIGLWNEIDYGINLDGKTPADGGKTMEYTAQVVTKNGGLLNMRSSKSTSANNRILQIQNGSEVTVIGEDGEWSEITYKGLKGYVINTYLQKVDGTEVPSDTITVDRKELERAYDILGDMLGLRG